MVRSELVDTLTGTVQAPDLLVRKLRDSTSQPGLSRQRSR
jgi:hypothetical protein